MDKMDKMDLREFIAIKQERLCYFKGLLIHAKEEVKEVEESIEKASKNLNKLNKDSPKPEMYKCPTCQEPRFIDVPYQDRISIGFVSRPCKNKNCNDKTVREKTVVTNKLLTKRFFKALKLLEWI